MSPGWAKAVFIASLIGMIVVRAPHIKRSTAVRVVESRQNRLDNVLVALVTLGFFLPLLWITTPLLAFADYRLRLLPFAVGCFCFVLGLWMLYRSHADLGTNWSNTLEVRERHELITAGIYHQVRHPMYSALLLHGLGQVLVVPNTVAGASFLVAFAALVAVRIGPEERMMRDAFGGDYEAYRARTKRLVPSLW